MKKKAGGGEFGGNEKLTAVAIIGENMNLDSGSGNWEEGKGWRGTNFSLDLSPCYLLKKPIPHTSLYLTFIIHKYFRSNMLGLLLM